MKETLSKVIVIAVALLFVSAIGFTADTKTPAKPVPPAEPAVAKPEVKKSLAKILIDINTATLDQLKSLPGISDAYAKKIIDKRPYARKDQLKSNKIIPNAVYKKIESLIVVKLGSGGPDTCSWVCYRRLIKSPTGGGAYCFCPVEKHPVTGQPIQRMIPAPVETATPATDAPQTSQGSDACYNPHNDPCREYTDAEWDAMY
jgi:hypothetical protein